LANLKFNFFLRYFEQKKVAYKTTLFVSCELTIL